MDHPLYLFGKSYGTVRAVSVARWSQGTLYMYLNGIILVMLVLDFDTQGFEDLAWGRACIGLLPTYVAIAHYHGHSFDCSLEDVLAEAERFADGPYRKAVSFQDTASARQKRPRWSRSLAIRQFQQAR